MAVIASISTGTLSRILKLAGARLLRSAAKATAVQPKPQQCSQVAMRWHGFSDHECQAYMDRLEKEDYDYMKAGFTMVIAHHSFLNPLDWRT